MAQTFVVHKAAVDAAMPTPAIVWQLLDHTPDDHRSTETAQFQSVFNGLAYHFIASTYIASGVATFGINQVVGSRGRVFIVTAQADWPAAAALFLTHWDGVCDAVRADIATRNYGQDVKTDLGAVRDVSHDARLRSMASGTTGQNEFVTVIILPTFDPDVLAYTSEAYEEQYQVVVVRENDLSTVRWTHGGTVFSGLIGNFSLGVGFNYITGVVTAQDGYTTRAYKLTINRVR